jgi:hypothetical protein
MNLAKQTPWQRGLLVAAGIYAVLRLLIHFFTIPDILASTDLTIYLRAAQDLQAGQALYRVEELAGASNFQYAPAFALAYTPLLGLPLQTVVALLSFFYPLAFSLLFWRWDAIFRRLELDKVRKALWSLLPLALVYEVFWSDISYMNFYILLPLLATLLLEAILDENLPLGVLWLGLILPIKPFWAFPLLLPLVCRRWRYFLSLAAGGAGLYLFFCLLTGLVAGWEYAFGQYLAYAQFTLQISANFTWKLLANGDLLGYNHSIRQALTYFLGDGALTAGLAAALKVALFVPFLVSLYREWANPGSADRRLRQLDLFWGVYLVVFLGLDVVWELALGLVLCAVLWPSASRLGRIAMTSTFGLVALLDVWRLLTYLIGGDAIITPKGEMLTDPAVYFPLVLVQILVFYALWLVNRFRPARQVVA